MKSILQHDRFAAWHAGLKDGKGRAIIADRMKRLARGLEGDAKSVGDGVRELRIAFGPGYRIYFAERGGDLIVLLAGGTKRRQRADVAAAKHLLRDLIASGDV
ncbi:MAG: type II toxin-antitoxin system RelE/ParE family toxin [Pacificimonas sp.]|nr:type II toxin-antitoxin system RelE/ParE family toxin [Pacificimonas sp.]